ncbi:MAG: hypothetical protein Q4C61_12105 [Lachnospiraceae bacterium]|nr:hypothetical protein [Lachnospiraceae bacterium]
MAWLQSINRGMGKINMQIRGITKRKIRVFLIWSVMLSCISVYADNGIAEQKNIMQENSKDDSFSDGEILSLQNDDKVEGEGYLTSREAVAAYIEAIKSCNIEKIISTFAVESYVDYFDFDSLIETNEKYMPYIMFLPQRDELARKINIENRRSNIITEIANSYKNYALSSDHNYDNSFSYLLTDFGTAENMMDKIFANDVEKLYSSILFTGEFVDQEYEEYENFEHLGADEISTEVAVIEMGGQRKLLYMHTVRYGDKWYMLNTAVPE